MYLLILLIMTIAMRYFLFEIKFFKVRKWLMDKSRLWNIFLNCPFCNGFWTGLFTYLIFLNSVILKYDSGWALIYNIAFLLYFATTVGASSYLIEKFFNLIEKEDSYSPE